MYRCGGALSGRDVGSIIDFDDEFIGDSWEVRFTLNTGNGNSTECRAYAQQKDQRRQAFHDDGT